MNLLTVSKPKTTKSQEHGYLTGILHLKPNYAICPNASKGCMAACLNTAGRGGMDSVQKARAKRTALFMCDPGAFKYLVADDITKLRNKARKQGKKLAIRLNGTSDIGWENEWAAVFKQFPDVIFYDYTPNFPRMCGYMSGLLPDNYKLCFSLKEDNMLEAETILSRGGNVAVVFRGKLPKTWKGKQVVDGDAHDLRFLDPDNVVVGLTAKGKAKKDTSGFVQEVA